MLPSPFLSSVRSGLAVKYQSGEGALQLRHWFLVLSGDGFWSGVAVPVFALHGPVQRFMTLNWFSFLGGRRFQSCLTGGVCLFVVLHTAIQGSLETSNVFSGSTNRYEFLKLVDVRPNAAVCLLLLGSLLCLLKKIANYGQLCPLDDWFSTFSLFSWKEPQNHKLSWESLSLLSCSLLEWLRIVYPTSILKRRKKEENGWSSALPSVPWISFFEKHMAAWILLLCLAV